MEKLQKERDKLLLYALQNPPPYVTIILPTGVKSAAELNLSQLPSPLQIYSTSSATNVLEIKLQGSPLTFTVTEVGSISNRKSKIRPVKRFSGFLMNVLRGGQHLSTSKEVSPMASSSKRVGNFFSKSGNIIRGNEGDESIIQGSPTGEETREVTSVSTQSSVYIIKKREPLPLEGVHNFTLSEYIAPYVSKEEFPVKDIKSFSDPPLLELCPVMDNDMFIEFNDNEELILLIYEHILLSVDLLLGKKRKIYEEELSRGFQKAFKISNEQHYRIIQNLSRESFDKNKTSIQINVNTIKRLIETSENKEFSSRMKKLLRVCLNHPDEPDQLEYPLALRAFIYAGALSPLYKIGGNGIDGSILQEEQLCQTLNKLRNKLRIPSSIDVFCRLHARLLSIDEELELEVQWNFLKKVAQAVNALSKFTHSLGNEVLTPENKYKLYILQETFEMCCTPMNLIGTIDSDRTLLCVSALFMESCVSLPPEFLSVYIQIDGHQILPPTSPVNDFLLTLITYFATRGLLSRYSDDKYQNDYEKSPHELLKNLNGVDEEVRPYLNLISHSVNHASALIIPPLLAVSSHVLTKHWEKMIQVGKIPGDFTDGIAALFAFLKQFSSEGVEDDKEISRVLALGAHCCLSWIIPLMKSYDDAVNERIEKKLQNIWNIKQDINNLTPDIMHAMNSTLKEIAIPMPIPILPFSQDTVRQRLSSVTIFLNELSTCVMGLFISAEFYVDPITTKPNYGYIQQYKILLENGEKMLTSNPQLDDIALRLNFISSMEKKWKRIITLTEKDYLKVRRVIGAPNISFQSIFKSTGDELLKMEKILCEFAAIAIIRGQLGDILYEKFMKTDTHSSRNKRSDKTTDSKSRQIIREFPDITISFILQEMENVIGIFSTKVVDPSIIKEIQAKTILYLVAALFFIYLDGSSDRFFSPGDWEDIIQDLDVVEAYILNLSSTISGLNYLNSIVNWSLELLQRLQQIVRYCFSQPTSVLIDGGDGVPPFSKLPENSDTSPWCKYVVRRVVEHRKEKMISKFLFMNW